MDISLRVNSIHIFSKRQGRENVKELCSDWMSKWLRQGEGTQDAAGVADVSGLPSPWSLGTH